MAGSLGKILIGKISLGVVSFSKGSIGNIVLYSAGNTVTYHVDTDVVYREDVDADDTVLSPRTFTPTKEGWEFWGWKQDTAANSGVLENLTMGDDPITLYAVFRKAVTVTYYNPNVNTATNYIYYNNGTVVNPKFTISPNSYSGWTFRGWSATNAPNGKVIYQSVSSTEITSNVTLYQSFQKTVALTVYNGSTTASTYNGIAYGNGGAGGYAGGDIYPAFTVTPATVTGFSFRGWSTSNVGSAGITYSSLNNTQIGANTTLYALYQQTITLSYNANGGSGTTAAQSGTRYYNSIGTYINPTFTVRANAFTNTNRTFSTWRLNGTSGTAYAPNASLTLAANATLYAIWVGVPFYWINNASLVSGQTLTWTKISGNAAGFAKPAPSAGTCSFSLEGYDEYSDSTFSFYSNTIDTYGNTKMEVVTSQSGTDSKSGRTSLTIAGTEIKDSGTYVIDISNRTSVNMTVYMLAWIETHGVSLTISRVRFYN